MRFIVFALVQSPAGGADAEVYRNEADLMVYAEDLGFDAVWMAEHHFHGYCITPDPLLLATHVAARTKRIRIGTAANVLPLSHPVRVGRADGDARHPERGAARRGVRQGLRPPRVMGYGVDQRESEERFREALEIIFAAWTQDEFSYDGRHFTSPRRRYVPGPALSRTPAPTSPPPARSRPSTSRQSSAFLSTWPTGVASTSTRSRSATAPRRRPTDTMPRRWTQPLSAPR